MTKMSEGSGAIASAVGAGSIAAGMSSPVRGGRRSLRLRFGLFLRASIA
jgi:hypothetical protein